MACLLSVTIGFEWLRIVKVAPIEAIMMQEMAIHCVNDKTSFRNRSPESAPKAGSMLIKVPNVRVGMRVRAIISSV